MKQQNKELDLLRNQEMKKSNNYEDPKIKKE